MITKTLEKHKWGIEIARTALVAAFAFGTIWQMLNGRVSALEKNVSDMESKDVPTRIEFTSFKEKTQLELTMSLEDLPERGDVKEVQNSLNRIESNLRESLPRIRKLERDVAVILATKREDAR